MEHPLISVIVPVYRVEAYLGKCVDSILAQTYENLEVILVDDGSPDGSSAICDDYAVRDPRVRVIHKENGGLSSARNAGLDAATGDYIGFVDSDDWLEPETYAWLMDMVQQENVKLVCAGRFDCNSWDGSRTVGLCPQRTEVITGEEMTRRIFRWENVDSAAVDKLYHRSLFDGIRYPIGVVSEDVPVTWRLALRAGRVGLLDKPVYNYFHRPGSITTSAFSPKTFQPSVHTAKILEKMRQEHPRLVPEATYFHCRHLVYVCQCLVISDREVRKQYAAEYKEKLGQLRTFLPFIRKSPLLTRQERLTWLTLCWGCYGTLRKFYHIGRK